MKGKRRFISWILTVAMAISFVPLTGLTAFAAEDDVLFTVQYYDQVEAVTQEMWDQWMADDDMVIESDYTKASSKEPISYENVTQKGVAIEDIYCELFEDFSVNDLQSCKFAIDPVGYTKGSMNSAQDFFKGSKTYQINVDEESGAQSLDEESAVTAKPIVTAEENGRVVTGLYEVGSGNTKYWYKGVFGCNTADRPAFAIISTDGSGAETGFSGGNGTAENPYKIKNEKQLNAMAAGINNGTLADKSFVLTADISLSENWLPAGTEETAFSGTFDGAGHVISGMSINSDTGYAGLFGNVTGTVKDLEVAGTITVSGSVDFVGGVAGKLSSGSISGCVSKVNINAGEAFNVGGIAGFNGTVDNYDGSYAAETAEISGCINYGDVKGQQKVGGITGENAGRITGCANKGHIQTCAEAKGGTGGIAGRNGNADKKGGDQGQEAGVIIYCYNTGLVECASHETGGCSWLGGIAGFNSRNSSVSNCYNVGTIGKEYNFYAAIVGNQEGSVDKNYSLAGLEIGTKDSCYAGKTKTASEMKSAKFVTLVNGESGVLKQDKSTEVNNGFPKLAAEQAVSAYQLSSATVTVAASSTYSGTEKTPSVTVKVGEATLVEGVDYTVKYSNNVEVGQATVKIYGKGKYTGSASASFRIVPKTPSVKSLTSGYGKLTVKATSKPSSTGGTYYQIAYKQKATSTWKYTTTSSYYKTIKSLKKGKYYYVKVRAYKTVDNVKYYGPWSKTKLSSKIK